MRDFLCNKWLGERLGLFLLEALTEIYDRYKSIWKKQRIHLL
jgi:hypothetical protein